MIWTLFKEAFLVHDCYRIEDNHISWVFNLRRELRSFEIGSRVYLVARLGEFPVSLGDEDELVWTGDSSDIYSVQSMVGLSIQ